MEIGAKGDLCGKFRAGDHDLIDLGRQLIQRRRVDHAAKMAPDDRPHAHGTRLAGGIERGPPQRRAAVLCEPVPDRLHLAMGGWIIEAPTHVGAASNHFPVAHDHRAERIICLARLLDRHAHEALVVGRCGRGRTGRYSGNTDGQPGHCGEDAPSIRVMDRAGMRQVRHLAIYRAA